MGRASWWPTAGAGGSRRRWRRRRTNSGSSTKPARSPCAPPSHTPASSALRTRVARGARPLTCAALPPTPASRPLPKVLQLADWVWGQFYDGATLKPAERGRLASKLLRHHNQVHTAPRAGPCQRVRRGASVAVSADDAADGAACPRAGRRRAGDVAHPQGLPQVVPGAARALLPACSLCCAGGTAPAPARRVPIVHADERPLHTDGSLRHVRARAVRRCSKRTGEAPRQPGFCAVATRCIDASPRSHVDTPAQQMAPNSPAERAAPEGAPSAPSLEDCTPLKTPLHPPPRAAPLTLSTSNMQSPQPKVLTPPASPAEPTPLVTKSPQVRDRDQESKIWDRT